ncbi:hypothetical protein QBC45DRAFT_394843 [Copromyces sp. CBS 386.78]|nr:hypothetical protein QBC45DRAFT_394843 [Copromyces sp. CBS 386.78]
MYPRRHTDNGEGSSRGSGRRENPPRRPPRITVVIRDEPVDGPPPHIEREEERRHPWPPLRFPPPMVRGDPPTRPLPPVPAQRRGGFWARAQELLDRNRHFLDRIDREVALDRLEARQNERRAQPARQNRRVEEARRDRHGQGRRQEEEAERGREEHLEQVARRGERNRQQDGNVPAARANPVEERPAPVNRPPGAQIPAPVPAAPVITPTTANAVLAPVTDPNTDDGELVPCAVCTEEFPLSQVLTTSCAPEPHHFCGQCLQSFFRNAMDGNVWRNADSFPPTCCGNRFYIHDENISREVRARNQRFHRLLGVDMVRQYFARTEQVRMERGGTGTRCSNQDCGWLVPERFTGVEGRRDTEVVCHNCRQVTCTICEGRAHRTRYQERCPGPRRRTEDQQQAEEQADEQFLRLRREEGWPTCPTCGWTVQKNGGCHLIECFRCGTFFCYHCLLIYPDGHGTPPLCLCPIFVDGEAEGRIQERRAAGIPDHVPEGEEDDFFHGGDHHQHQPQHQDGHHRHRHHRGQHHHDQGHHDQHDHGRHHRHHRHVAYILDHVLDDDDDFFHGGDHRDILDHAPEELLNLPIEWDSDDDDEDLDADDLRFIFDVLRRR